jgi:hypothetical protein
MILQALDELGGVEYLKKLGVENSSAFSSMINKVLPTTLNTSDSDGGSRTVITFKRIIVAPDGHKHIEGERPLQLPAPVAKSLPDDLDIDD